MQRLEVHHHIMFVLPRVLGWFLLFDLALLLFLVLYIEAPDENIWLQIALQLIALASGLEVVSSYVEWRLYSVRLNDSHIVERRGLLQRRNRRLNLMGAVIECRQSLIDRTLDCGTLIVTMPDGETFRFPCLADFSRIRRLFGR